MSKPKAPPAKQLDAQVVFAASGSGGGGGNGRLEVAPAYGKSSSSSTPASSAANYTLSRPANATAAHAGPGLQRPAPPLQHMNDLSEEEQIEQNKVKISGVLDETLESTERSIQRLQESNQIGQNAVMKLAEDSTRIKNINKDFDKMNEDMVRAEKELTTMESCCCTWCCWNKKHNFESTSAYKNAHFGKPLNESTEEPTNGIALSTKVSTNKAREEMREKYGRMPVPANVPAGPVSRPAAGGDSSDPDASGGGAFVPKDYRSYISTTAQQVIGNDEREQRINKNVDVLAELTTDLKYRANDMKGELNKQHHLLNGLHDKADSNQERVKHIDARTKGLIRNG